VTSRVKIAILGRTRSLLETAHLLVREGYQVVLVATGRPVAEDTCSVDDYRSAADGWGSEFLEKVDLLRLKVLLNQTRPDLGVSSNYPIILPAKIVDIPSYGILNAHGGDLPRYRGNACQAWAILQGERNVALCIHRMVGGEVDSGDIIIRQKMEITNTTKVGAILDWMSSILPTCFLEAVKALESDPEYFLERQSRDSANSLRCFPRRPEDGKINWNSTAVDVVRLVNASGAPYGGAFAMFENRRLVVEDASVVDGLTPYLAVPGQVLDLLDSSIVVACGQGAVQISKAWFDDDKSSLTSQIRSVRARLT